jgi:hypothetical protein
MKITFEKWLEEVDTAITAWCGLSHLDLADQTWYDWYDSNMPPKEAAEIALDDEGFPVF